MGAIKIHLDANACTGCMTCVKACFVDVLRWDPKEERPIVAYPEDCVWCFACEIACPEACIEVEPDVPGRLCAPY